MHQCDVDKGEGNGIDTLIVAHRMILHYPLIYESEKILARGSSSEVGREPLVETPITHSLFIREFTAPSPLHIRRAPRCWHLNAKDLLSPIL